MAYENKRVKILNILKNAFIDNTNYFNSVSVGLMDAGDFPNALSLPSLYIARSTEAIELGTNTEAESEMGTELIGVCQADSDLDIVKTEMQEKIEEIAFSLLRDDDFLSLATYINIESVDMTPQALMPLGYTLSILPPFGIVKISGNIRFLYNIL